VRVVGRADGAPRVPSTLQSSYLSLAAPLSRCVLARSLLHPL
jgi:hypothetical protein